MPHYAYLHLATHGFFAPPELKSALDDAPAPAAVVAAAAPDRSDQLAAGPAPVPTTAGIGAAVKIDSGKLKVTGLAPGGAADSDGRLKTGDTIIAVQDASSAWTSFEGKTVDEAIALIHGPAGSTVHLRIQPAAGGDSVEYELTRKVIVAAAAAKQPKSDFEISGYHPDLLAGLALAGANQRRTGAGRRHSYSARSGRTRFEPRAIGHPFGLRNRSG